MKEKIYKYKAKCEEDDIRLKLIHAHYNLDLKMIKLVYRVLRTHYSKEQWTLQTARHLILKMHGRNLRRSTTMLNKHGKSVF